MRYETFLDAKRHLGGNFGFDPLWIPDFLFDFQKALVEWAIRKGRGAIFADCGLGKTPMELVWAENVVRHTGKTVLILAPLAVSYQIVREAEKFGIEANRTQYGEVKPGSRIIVTNYERLTMFNPNDFAGVVCDESSILKNFNGTRRSEITAFMRKMPYRLLGTATAAPNDYIELGTSSEALGELGYMDMLGRFFRNTQNTSDTKLKWRNHGGQRPQWRFKGHAEEHFWRWVCSWARACRRPSDLGFDDNGFILPPIHEIEHVVKTRSVRDGWLFEFPAQNFYEEREERRRTITERCERVAELANHDKQVLVWCHMNDEGNLLTKMIDGAEQVTGSDSDEAKEATLLAFATGQLRALVTKPKIGAWGLNLQNCSHITFFPSHSYEQYYQGVRRCWRFGQQNEVTVDIVASEGQVGIKKNLRRKADQADAMFSRLVANMNEALAIDGSTQFTKDTEVPAWLS